MESSDSETYLVKNKKKSKKEVKVPKKTISWKEQQKCLFKNPNRKNKHATKVMLSMKLKIVVRKVQKNLKRLQLRYRPRFFFDQVGH